MIKYIKPINYKIALVFAYGAALIPTVISPDCDYIKTTKQVYRKT